MPHLGGTQEEAEANDCSADFATGEAASCAPAEGAAGAAAATAGTAST